MKLAIAGFIVPYMFVYNEALLLLNTTFIEGALVVVTSITGVVMLGAAAEGYLFTKIPLFLRILLFGGALLFMNPNLVQDLMGFAIIGFVLLYQWWRGKKQAVASETVSL